MHTVRFIFIKTFTSFSVNKNCQEQLTRHQQLWFYFFLAEILLSVSERGFFLITINSS